MGYWGAGPFENDEAGDLFDDLDDLSPGQRYSFISRALRSADAEMPFDECSSIVAAVAIVAYLTAPFKFSDDGYLPSAEVAAGIAADGELRKCASSAMSMISSPHSNWIREFSVAGYGSEAQRVANELIEILSEGGAVVEA